MPSDGRPLLLRIRWTVFTESLLSNGHDADPKQKTHIVIFVLLLCAYIAALFSNGYKNCVTIYVYVSSLVPIPLPIASNINNFKLTPEGKWRKDLWE
jgi:accessory gene regulator protein AgrB